MNLAKRIHVAALAVAGLLITSAAHAQYVTSYTQAQPLYPYVVQQPQYYAQPQYAPQPYPYVPSGPNMRRVPNNYGAVRASAPARKASKTDPALVEELRSKARKSRADRDNVVADKRDVKIDKKVVVRGKPIVRKHVRVVDNPPIVVQREIDGDSGQVLSEQRVPTVQPQAPTQAPITGRVIHAEAEVTILGPDRMSIRLYRKGDGRDAQAKALPSKPKKKTEKSQPES
jgi:hypothetical protein